MKTVDEVITDYNVIKDYESIYIAFCETEHGGRYWRETSDPDTLDQNHIKYLVEIRALTKGKAFFLAKEKFDIYDWQDSKWFVNCPPRYDYIEDINWEGIEKELGIKLAGDEIKFRHNIGLIANLTDGRKLIIDYDQNPEIVENI